MGPCQVCGETVVDAAGYCVRCRTYRGPATPPTSGAPYSGAPYSAAPYSAAPVTAPLPPGGYPGPAGAPPAQPGRSPFLVSLIAACIALVVVAIGIVVVVVVKSSGKPVAAASSSPAPVVDPCIVGTWTVSSASMLWPVAGVGNITLTSRTSNQTVVVRADGTADDDYGDSRYAGTSGGHTYTLAVTGTVHYSVRTGNDTLTFIAPSASGTVTFSVDGAGASSFPLSVSTDPVRYTCSQGSATEHTDIYDATLTRRS